MNEPNEPKASGAIADLLKAKAGMAASMTAFQASGPIRFDASGLISGKLTVHVVGAEALPNYFRSLPAAAQPVANAFAGGVLMLGTPTTLDGRAARALALRINGGVVRMGPLALGRIPPLF